MAGAIRQLIGSIRREHLDLVIVLDKGQKSVSIRAG